MDIGHKQTDKILLSIEKLIGQEFVGGYMLAREQMQDLVSKIELGKTPQERMALANKYDRLDKLCLMLSKDMANLTNIAQNYIKAREIDVYILNYLYAGYDVAQLSLLNMYMPKLSKDFVSTIIMDFTPFSQLSYKSIKDPNKSYAKIKREFINGFILGESVQKIAKRLKKVYEGTADELIRVARTETTNIQSKARLDNFEKAKEMGIDIQKKWISTLDQRTRPRHRKLMNEIQDLDKPFSNGLMRPGDTFAGKVEEVVNCRCTMVAHFKGYVETPEEKKLNKKLKDMTFEEWGKEYGNENRYKV